MKFKHKDTGSIIETLDENTFNLFERNGFVEYVEPEVIVEAIDEKKIEIVEVKQAVKPGRKPPGRPKK